MPKAEPKAEAVQQAQAQQAQQPPPSPTQAELDAMALGTYVIPGTEPPGS